MTRNEFKTKAKWAIIEKLEDGYEGYLCDLHDEVFNMEMYETNASKATRILDELGGYSVVAEVIKYEEDNFGQTSADKYDNPCWVLSMLWYIVGEEVMQDLFDGCELWDEMWNNEATEETNKALVQWLKENGRMED